MYENHIIIFTIFNNKSLEIKYRKLYICFQFPLIQYWDNNSFKIYTKSSNIVVMHYVQFDVVFNRKEIFSPILLFHTGK